MLTCKQVTELMTDYLERRLPLGQRIRFQMHLGFCRACRAYLRQMKATLETLERFEAPPVSDELEKELLVRFKNWRD
ncbi:MAG: zf-HC2 domain-containing protein [Acidobacteriota bacterium]|jgi:predicted anti-sigma-YlaC factor YlaD